jgi:hypothetical protein
MKSKHWFLLLALLFFQPGVSFAAQDGGTVETKVKTLTLDPNSQTPVVILETITDKKILPIWIDVPEAKAIALEMERVALPRPLTHDLIRNILQGLGATLRRVTITDLRNNTYFAVLSLALKGQELQIDSRPSDAIAVALRMKAPIFVALHVLAKSKAPPHFGSPGEQAQKRLGIQAQDLTEELAALFDVTTTRGVLVAEVIPGGSAMTAGIRRGDIIAKVNEKPVNTTNDLEASLRAVKLPGQIKLEVIKKGKATIVMIDLPSS